MQFYILLNKVCQKERDFKTLIEWFNQ